MTDPERGGPRPLTTGLAGLAGIACVACCLLPVLIAAGVLGSGAAWLVGWLPALAVGLAALAAGTWWLGRGRRWVSCSCGSSHTVGECGCTASPQQRREARRR
ncbi:hypothetical protein [Salinactinospora qingdaonensis]|uniref:Mercuric ion transport protein n=1 Tax=Salinactinospora qingdaonensis TaxID=702744 RepID=A0ABP7F4W5_9ACTN